MTCSPFDDYQRRIFLCHGNIRDKYMLHNSFQVNFDELLFLHLKERGYHPVLLYNHHGLYFYDVESRDWVIPPPDGATKTSSASLSRVPSKASKLAPGPGGLSLRRTAPPQQGALGNGVANTGRLLYPNLARITEIQAVLRRLMNECKQGAVIFDGDHLPDFAGDGAAIEQFRGLLERDLRQLSIDNQLIVIFISGLKGSQLADHLHYKKPVLNFLYQLDANGKRTGIATSIEFSSPGRDEVSALIDYYRLRRNLQVQWNHLQRNITVLTGYLKATGKGITDLDYYFNKLCQSNPTQAVLTTDQVLKITNQNIAAQSAEQRLAQMVGMDDLKQDIKSNINYFQQGQNAQKPLPIPVSATAVDRLYHPVRKGPEQFLHIALMGNPGTGKTTVAELIGEIYRDAGILETGHTVEVKRDDLVSGFVGQTAIKTREKIDQARGGVLFIDEAYSLVQGGQNDFGTEAITTLLETMSSLRSELVVIVAGYPTEIEQLIDSNPGFDSRFGTKITFPDLLPEQLATIFQQQCRQHTPLVTLTPELEQALPDFFKELYDSRDDKFANARTVIEKIFRPMVKNLSGDPTGQVLQADLKDIPKDYQKLLSDARHQKAPAPLVELKELIGLNGVKQQIQTLIAQLENDLARQQQGIATEPLAPGHYLFAGNPGTGKTTVARLMARQFKHMGLLPKDKLTERSASDLIGQYVGSTENTVKALLEEALGGVLFIDEAHQLATTEHGYGQNALAPFTAFMETHKHDICIIFAGYGDGINRLLSLDPGFRRRFTRIQFDDFNADELTSTFFHFANKSGFQVSPDIQQPMQNLFTWMFENKNEQFGNAGTTQQVFTMMKANLAKRMQSLNADGNTPTLEQRNTLLVSDIPQCNECRYLLGKG